MSDNSMPKHVYFSGLGGLLRVRRLVVVVVLISPAVIPASTKVPTEVGTP